MKIVIDANVEELSIVTSANHEVYLCRFIGVELFKHKEKIMKYSQLREEQIIDAYQLLLENTKAIHEYEIPVEVYKKAENLCKTVDPKDTVYVAATLFLDACLWTGDKKLREGLAKKGFTNTISTAELLANN